MNNISKTKSTISKLLIAGSMIVGLALAPATSIAAKDKHDGYRNHESHKAQRHQQSSYQGKHKSHKNRHYKQHNFESYHNGKRYKQRINHRGHYKKHNHHESHYVVHDYGHHHGLLNHLGFKIGLHTGNFDIVFRD